MASTIEALCNVALVRMGNKKLVGTLTSPTDEPGISANVIIAPLRQNLLRAFPWNFATRRRVLDDDDINYGVAAKAMSLALTDQLGVAATSGCLITATATAGFGAVSTAVLDLNIMEVNSGTGKAIIVGYTSTNVVTVDIIQGFSASTISASNWKVRLGPAAFAWDYRYNLTTYMSDWLRVWKVNNKDTGWMVENGKLLSNSDNVQIEYVADVTDVTKFDPVFDDVYAWLLAYEFSLRFSADKAVQDRMWKKSELALQRAEAIHSKEGTRRTDWKTWFEVGRS